MILNDLFTQWSVVILTLHNKQKHMLLTMKELQRSPLFQTRSYLQSYSVASICVLFEVAVIFLIMFIKSFGCQIGMLSPVMWSESNQEFPLLYTY